MQRRPPRRGSPRTGGPPSPVPAASRVGDGLCCQELLDSSPDQVSSSLALVQQDIVDQPFRPFFCGNGVGFSMVLQRHAVRYAESEVSHGRTPPCESALSHL